MRRFSASWLSSVTRNGLAGVALTALLCGGLNVDAAQAQAEASTEEYGAAAAAGGIALFGVKGVGELPGEDEEGGGAEGEAKSTGQAPQVRGRPAVALGERDRQGVRVARGRERAAGGHQRLEIVGDVQFIEQQAPQAWRPGEVP